MNTTINTTNRENMNAANIGASNKINDFGAKIGGARKDLYQAANEWAAQLADITAEALTKAGGVSKLVRLPNLESMTAAGAITADQARAALIIWRGIERKPQGSYRADRWAERTRARLEAAAAIITGTEPTADNVADIIKAARESAEYAVITAAQWPAEPFTFGNYTVSYSLYSEPRKLRIIGGHYYRGEASTDPADIARQLREMTAADAKKAAESRARGPRLGVYHTSDYTRYFIAVENKCEIVLKVCDTYQEATEAARNERAELLERYEALKSFPALRRSWNRPRVGKEWHAEDVTPEQFAAAIPFKGVEFGNWLNQDERAALLNSAFDGFHDLADLLGIPAAAVSLGGMLNFSFATRGHAGSAAHFDSCYNTINLNKRNGAGCMAHEWLHACDHFAAVLAGRGSCMSWGEAFATECNKESDHPADIAARELVAAIRKMDYYTRSRNYQTISGKSQGGADYYTQPCELAARGFEGVVLYLLNCAGGCSDFLVNLQSWRDFERDDAGHRRDCYPYPSDAEAAALVPYYVAFFRALFGSCQVSQKAAEGVAAATLQAQQEKAEADRRAQEKAEQERKESEARRAARRAELDRKAEEQRKENERKAAEVKAKAEATRAAIVERLTAAHFDTIATDCDAAAVYFAAHLEGEIYTGKVEIKSDPAEIAAAVQGAPVACLLYKYIHNAKRVICRRWQVASVRSNKRTARELLASLQPSEVRAICRAFVDFERADNWQKAARIWSDTQRTHEAQKAAQKPANESTANEPTESKGESVTTAQGLTMEKYSEKATVIRGYNADQLAELLAMGGKEWRNLRGGKGVIFSTRRHGDELAAWMEAQQGEGTTAPAADQPAPVEDPAAVLPDWLRVGARVRTRGRYMLSARTMRREWVEGEEMTVKTINADFVSLENRDENGALTGLQSIATENAAAELTPVLYEASEITAPAESEPAAIAASEEEGAPLTEPNRDGLPDWLHVGTRFCLLDHVTGNPTAVRYTCAAIDYENKTVTIPEAADTFRGGSHVYRWDAFHWATFAPISEGEGEAETPETWQAGRVTVTKTADTITTTENRITDVFEIVTEWPANYYVWSIGREHFPLAGWLPLAKDGHNAESWQRNIDRDHLKAIKVQSEAAALACIDYAHHHDRPTREDFLQVLAQYPTDPTPEPSGEGVGVCHSYDASQGTTLQDSGEIKADPLCITITREEIEATSALYNFAADTLARLRYINPECINAAEGCAYVWDRPDIDKAADALNIDRTALFDWCYNNSDFVTTRVIARAAIALSPNSPAPNQAHRLFDWLLIEEKITAVGICHSYETGAPCYSTSEKSEPTAKAEQTRNQEIAKIILQQLGGRQFAMMTGAKQFVAIDNGVRFRIGRNATRANLVKIVLRGDDTYNMEFWHIGQEVNPYTILMRYADKGLSEEEFNKQVKAAEPVKLKAYEGIYCDQLQELFTEYTELYTRLF